jgi:nitrogen fixation protein NifQ
MNPSHDCRELLQAELLGRPASDKATTDPLRPILASLLVGRSLNQGVLPAMLGLSEADFQALWNRYFPGAHLHLQDGPGAGLRQSEVWLAHIVAYSCCGRNHLWQDLGLANRGELSALMTVAFPTLAALNVGDMKWKKFIYRHYCSKEGIYVCPAPSCSECADHAKCFAPEV